MSLRNDVEDRIKSVRDALAGNDVSRIRSAVADLESTMQRVGQEIYAQSEAPAGSGASNPAPRSESGGKSGTVEGEYREV